MGKSPASQTTFFIIMAQFYSQPRQTPRQSRTVTVTADSLDALGQGIARLQGKTVFIPDLMPDESAQVRLTEEKRHFAKGSVVKRLSDNPARRKPACRHYGQCGGCQQQHIPVAMQRETKAAYLAYLLTRETGEACGEIPVLSGEEYGYRRRARLALVYSPKTKQLTMGFRQAQSKSTVAVTQCPVLVPRLEALLVPLQRCLSSLAAAPELGHAELADTESGPLLVLRHLAPLSDADVSVLTAFCAEHNTALYLQGSAGAPPVAVCALYPPHYAVAGLKLQFSPQDFIQVNGALNELMVAQALNWLELTKHDRVLDLFCGMGNFTLPVAERAGEVVGVEGVDALVRTARENARLNNLANAAFYHADLSQDITGEPWAASGFNKVLLDPARAGAAEIMPHIVALSPERIVYVSCNPTTLARDSQVLHGAGYHRNAVRMLDMFPQTGHLESMVLFTKTPPVSQ
ncbi:23S rRNA (uracil(1939)-C(5))-methyltransferase RlmD [Morganella morganii]|uniref:23S rRNA (uracil(1939)-C(5))-methyltransferase RlmD n=1 Tax=Morganella morganii TaxID=582 RepID=UPI00339C6914